MKRTKAREERKERVRKMYLQKINEEDIAKEMNLSLSTVRSYISELGLKKRDWESIRQGIVEMYSSGKDIKEIMEKWKVSQPYINKAVRRYGITTRRFRVTENNLIDENTVFADNRVRLEMVIEGGKRYVDIMPVISPR